MKLKYHYIRGWRKLAWVAAAPQGAGEVTIHHGLAVEIADEWCFEGVWAGDFSAGGFDCTDIVAGTGVRLRGKKAVFVSSGNTLDRLWHCSVGGTLYVSNSLPALLSVAQVRLSDEHDYGKDLATVVKGLRKVVRTFPAEGTKIDLTYYHNLVLENDRISECPKPNGAPSFRDFAAYDDFLHKSAEEIHSNYAADCRRLPVDALATISRGYDSPASAVVAKRAGCGKSLTISRSTAIIGRNDCGVDIASRLGLACEVHEHRKANYMGEIDIWAVMGDQSDLNLTVFNYSEPITLLFTGFHGDKVWDRQEHELADLQRGDHSGAHFTEFRLRRGVFNCAVPFWGIQEVASIQRISRSGEMIPWTLGNNYDRPIPRRLVESSGVPRSAFGMRKNATIPQLYCLPTSRDLVRDFEQYLSDRGMKPMSAGRERLTIFLHNVGWVTRHLPLLKRLGIGEWLRETPRDWLFRWANARLTSEYAAQFDA